MFSTHQTPRRRERGRSWLVWLLVAAMVVVAAHLLDRQVALMVPREPAELKDYLRRVESNDWYRLMRVAGFWPTWMLVGAMLWLPRRTPRQARNGLFIVLSSGLAGGAAELLKLVIARERPSPEGLYVFRGLFSGFLDGKDLGMPSSHAAVAFGAASAMAMLWPRAWAAAAAIGLACGLSRLLAGAHFLSDVTVAGILGFVAAWGLRRVMRIDGGR